MEIRISDELNDIIRYARDEAMRTGSYGIGPDHLFLGVLRHGDNAAFRTVTGLGIDADNFKRFIDSHIFTNEPIPYAESDKISFTRYAQNVLSITVLEASKQGVTEANSLHLLLALCRTTENYGQAYLRQHGVDYGRLLSYMRDEGMLGKDPEQEDDKSEDDQQETNQESKPEKSVIEDFGFDLTKAAAEGKLDPVVGRETEIARVIEILGRRKKNNPMLIGEPGVGKSAIVEGIALRIAAGEISPALAKKRLISLDIASVVAGTKYRGDFEKRLKSIIREVGSNPDIILLASGSEVSTLVEGAALLRADGVKVRIVSVPSEGLFRNQSADYQEAILPAACKKFGLTAGLPVNLEGLVGANGKVWGLESFGFSAPYKVLDEKLGFTAQNVYNQVKEML